MKKQPVKFPFLKTTTDYLFEVVILSMLFIFALIVGFMLVSKELNTVDPVDPLQKYDSITVKLPVEEKVVNFNDVPKRSYYNELGILTVEF